MQESNDRLNTRTHAHTGSILIRPSAAWIARVRVEGKELMLGVELLKSRRVTYARHYGCVKSLQLFGTKVVRSSLQTLGVTLCSHTESTRGALLGKLEKFTNFRNFVLPKHQFLWEQKIGKRKNICKFLSGTLVRGTLLHAPCWGDASFVQGIGRFRRRDFYLCIE